MTKEPFTESMKKVPRFPDQVRLNTGDRARIQVSASRPGFLTVINVGRTGTPNLLYPDGDLQRAGPPRPIEPNRPLHIVDVDMTPPAGRERLFAVWIRQPLRFEELAGLGDLGSSSGSRSYRPTRDMNRMQELVRGLHLQGCRAAVLELDHIE
jgi:hypothetical protein